VVAVTSLCIPAGLTLHSGVILSKRCCDLLPSETLSVINDQIGVLTGADLLADVTALVISKITNGQGANGLYHCVSAGATSWF
jgi:dTDP-4-dehydrorhamnose reductase